MAVIEARTSEIRGRSDRGHQVCDERHVQHLLHSAWGALIRIHAATASYSWMRPPSRSLRRIAAVWGA
jgi:hypothetical protein